ncbi:MAG TPA: hypothetical protein VE961_16755 [Pyrinomonadaceae bacterium]|nr:hypothetical protein [Pyrinomonadaceae bacterium]
MKTRLALIVGVLLVSTGLVLAQSGRKSTGSSSSTGTATTPSVSGPKTSEKKSSATPKLQLLVGIDRNDPFTPVPLYVFDTVLDKVIRRLGEAEIVFATSGASMNRGDGVRAAKKETARWVIVLEIKDIYADAGKQVKNTDQDELVVEFTAIEPDSGKIKRSGKTHQLIYPNGRSSIALPTKKAGAVYSEYSINQAATEAADKILAGFDITVRTDGPQ